jgi:hypothetical protein
MKADESAAAPDPEATAATSDEPPAAVAEPPAAEPPAAEPPAGEPPANEAAAEPPADDPAAPSTDTQTNDKDE